MGKFKLPINHKPGMRVPEGGSCCANCMHYDGDGSTANGRCKEPNFIAWNGTDEIPFPPKEYCSDWYDWHGSGEEAPE